MLIVFGNAPVFIYNAVSGISFKILTFLLMGVGGSAMGYIDYSWQVAVPCGGLYVLWKLKNGLYTTTHDLESTKPMQDLLNNPAPPTETDPAAPIL